MLPEIFVEFLEYLNDLAHIDDRVQPSIRQAAMPSLTPYDDIEGPKSFMSRKDFKTAWLADQRDLWQRVVMKDASEIMHQSSRSLSSNLLVIGEDQHQWTFELCQREPFRPHQRLSQVDLHIRDPPTIEPLPIACQHERIGSPARLPIKRHDISMPGDN